MANKKDYNRGKNKKSAPTMGSNPLHNRQDKIHGLAQGDWAAAQDKKRRDEAEKTDYSNMKVTKLPAGGKDEGRHPIDKRLGI